MNERMIELYKKAAEFAYKICKDEGRTGGPTDHIWNTVSTGKFAELIVQETLMQMAIQMDKFGDNQANNPAWYKSEEAVEKHFGVKE